MANLLLISVTEWDTRVAFLEDGRLAEFYVEGQSQNGPVGNVYKGRVTRLLPGMAAAFVDVGLDLSIIHISEPTRRTPIYSSAASDVYKRQVEGQSQNGPVGNVYKGRVTRLLPGMAAAFVDVGLDLSIIHISEPTRRTPI